MKGTLLDSRWAPGNSNSYEQHDPYNQPSRRSKPPSRTHSVPASTTSPARPPSYSSHSQSQSHNHHQLPPAEELARFMKIVARLRWKLPFLAEGYRLATSNPSSEAEIMFKIDFFEYYALLERAIVHLLAVFNITVSSSGSARGRAPQINSSFNNNGTIYTNHNNGPNNTGSGRNGATLHRYHANVLSALEEESTPLTPVLGSGRVYEQLRQAKELRNRWKTADMTKEEVLRDPVGDRDRDRDGNSVRPLESYDLEGILTAIFAGLEEAFARAREHVALCRRPGEEMEEAKEEGWEFMVDAMDWEAV